MTTEGKNIILKANDLSIGYFNKKKPILISQNIHFSLAEGELVSVVGANGIGKSTLLRTLVGLQTQLNGSIELNGRSLNEYTIIQLASELSLVLTETPASKNLSVLELISLGRQPHTNWMGQLSEDDKKAIQYALVATNIESLVKRKCFELSDGQLQLVYIARALVQDTPLIILDEPTTHLDIYHRAYILKLLKDLAKETNKTILFSTHEIDLAIQLSDKMIVMAPNKTYFDEPCNLINHGRFDELFPKETISFDAKIGQFKVKS